MAKHLQFSNSAHFIIILLIFLSPLTVYSQIAGTYFIDNTHITGGQYFANFTDAITALNTGVTGPVTFNVIHDQVFNENPPVITAAGTNTNPVIFQKSGSGANPLVSGTGTTSIYDGIVVLAGAGYITFDGVDLKDSGSNIEWGYALLKKNDTSPFIGCQHVVIKNCNISLDRTNIWSVGIYSGNHTYTTPAAALPITLTSDAMNNCNFYNNQISNVYSGIKLRGDSLAVFPFNLYDQNNGIGVTETGANGPNTITKFGTVQDAGTWLIYGIYASYQNNIKINNNIVNDDSVTGGSASQYAPLYGIYLYNASGSNAEIKNNSISLNNANENAATSAMCGIYSLLGSGSSSNSVIIKDNLVHNCSYTSATTTGTFAGIQNAANAGNLEISGNTIDNNTFAGSGSFYGIDAGNPFTLNFYNNTVSNNLKTNSGNFYCTRITASLGYVSFYSNTVSNNVINIQSAATSSATLYGLSSSSTAINEDDFNNEIHDLSIFSTTSSASGTIYGMYFNAGGNNGNRNVYGNTIKALSVNNYNTGTATYATGYIYGINMGAVTNTLYLYKNSCFNFKVTGTTATIYGMNISSGYANYLYNNFVSDLNEPIVSSTSLLSLTGMSLSNTNSYSFTGAYFNTIYIDNSTTGAEFSSTGVYANASAGMIEVQNNIIVNTSTPAGDGITCALRRNNSTGTAYSVNSDANDLWAGTPDAAHLIYYDGTNSCQSVTELRNLFSTDSHSFSELPPFVNVTTKPYDLRINAALASAVESGGVPVTSPLNINVDFFGTARNSSYPDAGAYEFSGIKNDHSFPLFSFTPLNNTSSTSARTLNVTISDASGMPISGIALPVLYWKIGNGSWNPAQAIYTGGSYQFTFGSGAAQGNQVSYYIAAQDNSGNTGTTPIKGAGSFTINPPACGTPPVPAFMYSIVGGMSGVYYIGPNEVSPNFIHLKDAVAALNTSILNGPVTFILDSNFVSTGETFPVTFNKNPGSSETNTVTIKPAAPGVVFSGLGNSPASNTILILINGMSYLTIDGSSNGTTSRDLTISNLCPNGGSTVIYVASLGKGNGAAHVTIKNCRINATNKSGDYGIKVASQNVSNPDIGENNDYCTIENNAVTRCFYGIFVGGSVWGKDSGLKILNNKISGAEGDTANSVIKRGIFINGCIAPVISGNEISNMISAFQTGNNLTGMAAIDIFDGITDGEVSNNKIFNIISTYPGNQPVMGMLIGSSNAINVKRLKIFNNFISGISTGNYGTTTNMMNSPVGIRVNSAGELKVYFNTIYMNGIQTSGGLSPIPSAAFAIDAGNGTTASYNVDLRNNILINSLAGGIAGSKYYSVFIRAQGTVSNIDYNNYYAPSGTGLNGVLANWWGSDYTTLTGSSGLQNITMQDQHSKSDTVFFTSANDLHLAGSSVGDTMLVASSISGITTDIDGDTRFYIPYMGADEVPPGSSLPVELSSFDAHVSSRDVILYWKTSSEKNSHSFIIEKSSAADNFTQWIKSGEISSAGTSTSINEYSFTDRNLSAGKFSYRIKMVDNDGSFKYSKTIEVEILLPREFYLSQNYPNPFNPSTKINYQVPEAANVTIEVFDITGQKLGELINMEQSAGYYTVEISSHTLNRQLASGVYFYRISAVTRLTNTSYVNVKKMIVLK